jgi:hypothetical protein
MLTVLRFDVTSVKRPLIRITRSMTMILGTPFEKRSAFATLLDKPDNLYEGKEMLSSE